MASITIKLDQAQARAIAERLSHTKRRNFSETLPKKTRQLLESGTMPVLFRSGYESWATLPWQEVNSPKDTQRYKRNQPPTDCTFVAQFGRQALRVAVSRMAEAKPHAAAGPDRVALAAYSQPQRNSLCGDLAKLVIEGHYRPAAKREVKISKADGGTRSIHVANVSDKVIASQLTGILTPMIDVQLLDLNFGFRPGRGTHGLLAALMVALGVSGATVVMNVDVRGAFDHVPISAAIDSLEQLLSTSIQFQQYEPECRDRFLELARIVATGDDEQQTIGISQGCPFSPLLLNTLLHFAIDIPLQTAQAREQLYAGFRYADNVLAAVPSIAAGERIVGELTRQLQDAGLEFKPGDHVTDIAITPTTVFGFELSAEHGKPSLRLPPRALDKAKIALAKVYDSDDPAATAAASVLGTLGQYGPVASEHGEMLIEFFEKALADLDLREAAYPECWEYALAQAEQRWMSRLALARQKSGSDGVEVSASRDANTCQSGTPPQPTVTHIWSSEN